MRSLLCDESLPSSCKCQQKDLDGEHYLGLPSDTGKSFEAPQLLDKPRSRRHRKDHQYI